ncbi:MAG: cyclohexadienyl dehydrogenase [Candidatus Pelagibacter sp. TMED197]|nr:cyclohexadienyl dehydrogenase [Candidatus Pelagibacter sp.]OUW58204.1 MAG: cyclohexadienyl dehydrogenase [Candidatus Pelagibacter sp. TMED197]|tara:strand:- start:92 stop:997 length:906 start_codon:yes stop_codon:yes gene_type:complete
MFEKITIIGCGLIGSSILRNINNNEICKTVTVFDKSKNVLETIKKENLCGNISKDIQSAIKDSDLIILSIPLSSYKEVLLSAKDGFKKNAIITDTGSVKKEVNKIFENLNLANISWIASHPIAGTEESGPSAGFKDLFKNRWTIICDSKSSNKDKIEKLKKFWEFLGSRVKLMGIDEHDHILALTSHLPHAVAYNIVKTAINNDEKFRDEIIKYSAGGLRDFTRIASSDPLMWRDIFIDNSKNILKILDEFSKNIDDFKKAISEKNGDKLLKIFSSTKSIRKEIIKAGQDVETPDFGRKKN